MKTVTASEARRRIAAVLVATIEPVRRPGCPARPGAAKRRLLDRLAGVVWTRSSRWSRGGLYD